LFVRHIHMATRYPNFYLPERFRCRLLLATTGSLRSGSNRVQLVSNKCLKNRVQFISLKSAN
jgi:hypothetical protein